MYLAQHGFLGKGFELDPIAIIGDSVARGNSTAVGNTPTYNSTFQWDAGNSNLRVITNLDLLEPVAASAIGSQWPQFGDSYYQYTGRKAVFINCGIGGSSWENSTDTNFSWYTDGTLYSDAVTKINNCLTFLDRPLKAVYILLGINDAAQQSYTLSSTYLTSLIDRINTDFDSPRICISMPGKYGTTTLTELTRINTMCEMIKALSFTYANVELAGAGPRNFAAWVPGSTPNAVFNDDYHFNANGNNLFGDKLARQLAIPTNRYHKYSRGIIGGLYDNPSTERRGYIDTFITDLENASLLSELDQLYIFSDMGADDFNAQIDWAFKSPGSPVTGAGAAVGFTVDGMQFDGTNSFSDSQLSVIADKAVIATDFIWGAYVGSYNDTPAGTVGTLMGLRESVSGGIFLLRQTSASSISMWGGGTTASTDATDTKFQTDTHYAIARNAGNQSFIKNTTVVRTDAIASVAPGATLIRGYRIGLYNANGTLADFLDAEIKAAYFAKYTTWSVSDFHTILNNFLTNWMQ